MGVLEIPPASERVGLQTLQARREVLKSFEVKSQWWYVTAKRSGATEAGTPTSRTGRAPTEAGK